MIDPRTNSPDAEPSPRAPFSSWPGGAFLISTLPPSQSQRALARGLGLLLLAAFLVTVGFRHVQLPRSDAFVAIANTIIGLNEVITAALLFVQFSLTNHRALLVLGSGFLFKALMMIPYTLVFPGVFAPQGLFGSLQSPSFLYIAQNLVFLSSAVAYTSLRDRRDEVPTSNKTTIVPIAVATSAVFLSVLLVTWVLVGGGNLLPPIMADAVRTTSGFKSIGSWLFLLEIAVSLVIFKRRTTSMIDLWLKVAVWAWLLETVLVIIIESRFSLVFYVARTLSTVSSCFVLGVFFFESAILHRRLVTTLIAREQERQGHRSSIDLVVGTLAHELRQPLASILLNEQAGTKLVARGAEASAEIAEIFADIRESVTRSDEIINSVRMMFDSSGGDRAVVDANSLVRDAVNLVRLELEIHHIGVQLDLAPDLPAVLGHRGQLLEVLLNALKNAIESLVDVSDRERRLRIQTLSLEPARVAVTVEDSGTGVDPRARARAFEPFFSTKPRGMGLGLSICRSIVSSHGGTLELLPGAPRGAVFRVELPRTDMQPAAPAVSA